MKTLDDMLKQALTPNEEPDFRLNQNILSKAEEERQLKSNVRKMKKFVPAILTAAIIFGVGSVSIYAARKYLMPDKVAEKHGDLTLRDAFQSEGAVLIDETQSYGGYNVTLLGIVSGKELSKYQVTSDGEVLDDRTYAAVAIEKTDGTPMSETGEVSGSDFFVSPLIQGYRPGLYNIFTMNGAAMTFEEDNVWYQISECDNIEMFADHEIYMAVSDQGPFYNEDAYTFDETTGAISRNENYDGLNALFKLPLDASKADSAAVEEFIKSLEVQNDGSHEISVGEAGAADDEEKTEADREIEQFMEKLTPENIEEYATPVESTTQVLTPDKDGVVSAPYDLGDRGSGEAVAFVESSFPDHKTGMSDSFSCSYSDGGLDSLIIDTFTLNEDGTVTFKIYIPK
ncbi:MAG: hypothetical protein HFG80_02340 [Eubacterium sp.]|nr:hypothetical protein [Eubacterium sp.]